MPYPGRINNANNPYAPTVDGDFLQDFPMRLFEKGRFVKIPAILGDDTNEGTFLAPNASSSADIGTYFQDQFPQLSDNDTKAIEALYPLQSPHPFPNHAPFYASAARAISKAVLICPGIAIATAIAKYSQSWNYRYNVISSFEKAAELGSAHTSEMPLVFGVGQSRDEFGGSDPNDLSLSPILQAYYTSFVRSLDPNAHPVNGSLLWPQFSPATNKRLLLQVNATTLEAIPHSQRARCDFWKGLRIKMEQ